MINEKIFMGVSIRNPFYSNSENIIKAIKLAKDFNEFLIFVVDKPYSLSLRAFDNTLNDKAMEIALKEGEELKNFLVRISKNFGNVKIRSWSELEDERYNEIKKKLAELKKSDPTFSKLVEDEFTKAVIIRLEKTSRENYEQKKELCVKFILEEIAMFVSLFNKGYKTRVSKYERSESIDYFLKLQGSKIKHITIN